MRPSSKATGDLLLEANQGQRMLRWSQSRDRLTAAKIPPPATKDSAPRGPTNEGDIPRFKTHRCTCWPLTYERRSLGCICIPRIWEHCNLRPSPCLQCHGNIPEKGGGGHVKYRQANKQKRGWSVHRDWFRERATQRRWCILPPWTKSTTAGSLITDSGPSSREAAALGQLDSSETMGSS